MNVSSPVKETVTTVGTLLDPANVRRVDAVDLERGEAYTRQSQSVLPKTDSFSSLALLVEGCRLADFPQFAGLALWEDVNPDRQSKKTPADECLLPDPLALVSVRSKYYARSLV